jgi:CubicO group peptidase (beta-lactamase class C family)
MRYLLYLFLSVVCFACGSAQKPIVYDNLSSFITQKTDSIFKKNNLPGIFVGVIHNNERIFYNAGYAIPDTKTVFDSSTIFEIGSITKTFTAYILMRVLKERNISDSSSIISHLPADVQKNKALEQISFLSLMNHTSGLPRLPANLDLNTNIMAPYDDYSAELLYECLAIVVPKPTGKSNYSNLGMGLAGVLAERISGKKYAILLEEYIMRPFKIITPLETTATNKAQGYFQDQVSEFWHADVLAPAGGIKASSQEILNYLQYMSMPADGSTKETIEKLLQPTVSLVPKVSVCRAWHTIEEEGKPVIYWHNGGTYGFSTFAAFVKGQNKAVIVVINKFNQSMISDGLGVTVMKELIK